MLWRGSARTDIPVESVVLGFVGRVVLVVVDVSTAECILGGLRAMVIIVALDILDVHLVDDESRGILKERSRHRDAWLGAEGPETRLSRSSVVFGRRRACIDGRGE